MNHEQPEKIEEEVDEYGLATLIRELLDRQGKEIKDLDNEYKKYRFGIPPDEIELIEPDKRLSVLNKIWTERNEKEIALQDKHVSEILKSDFPENWKASIEERLSVLTKELAEILSNRSNQVMHFYHLKEISDDAADVLGNFKGTIILEDHPHIHLSISDNVAKHLASFKGKKLQVVNEDIRAQIDKFKN